MQLKRNIQRVQVFLTKKFTITLLTQDKTQIRCTRLAPYSYHYIFTIVSPNLLTANINTTNLEIYKISAINCNKKSLQQKSLCHWTQVRQITLLKMLAKFSSKPNPREKRSQATRYTSLHAIKYEFSVVQWFLEQFCNNCTP